VSARYSGKSGTLLEAVKGCLLERRYTIRVREIRLKILNQNWDTDSVAAKIPETDTPPPYANLFFGRPLRS
jgi:hypothetical protein